MSTSFLQSAYQSGLTGFVASQNSASVEESKLWTGGDEYILQLALQKLNLGEL